MNTDEKTYISIPAAEYSTIAKSYTRDGTIKVKTDPENNSVTEILDKDLKRWKRKLEKLARNKIPLPTIFFGLGTTGLSIFIPEISKKTLFLSLTTLFIIFFGVLLIISMFLWRHEANVSEAAQEIIDDLSKLNLTSNEEK